MAQISYLPRPLAGSARDSFGAHWNLKSETGLSVRYHKAVLAWLW